MISTLSEADLHGLVDGHLEPARRTDVLKRLALSAEDRVRVEAWQQQTDLLRHAFIGIEREPLPANLDLSPKTRLRCVSVLDEPVASSSQPARAEHRSARSRFASGRFAPSNRAGTSCLLAAACVGLGWIAVSYGPGIMRKTSVAAPQPVTDILARRAGEVAALRSPNMGVLPAVTIPDLGSAGFSLVGVDTAKAPASLQMIYRNEASERLVISVAHSVDGAVAKPVRVGNAYVWRTRANAFAMTGTIEAERLRAMAAALQADDIQ